MAFAQINRLPRGLLDFLGIRSGGRYPQQMLEQLVPQLNLNDWYMESSVTQVAMVGPNLVANSNAGVFNFTSTSPQQLAVGGAVVVPADEIWIVRNAQMAWNFSADAGLSFAGTMGSYNVNASRIIMWPMRLIGYAASSAAAALSGQTVLTSPVWVQPGDNVMGYRFGGAIPAGACQLSGGMSFVRLRS